MPVKSGREDLNLRPLGPEGGVRISKNDSEALGYVGVMQRAGIITDTVNCEQILADLCGIRKVIP